MLKDHANRVKKIDRFCLENVWEEIPTNANKNDLSFSKLHAQRAITNIYRSIFSSSLIVSSIFITLFLISIFFVFFKNINSKLSSYINSQSVSVYLEDSITEAKKTNILNRISSRSDVVSLEFWSKGEALNRFKKTQNNTLSYISKLDNPLPASFEIKLNTNSFISNIKQDLKSISGITEVNYQASYYQKLANILYTIKKIGLGFIILISAVTVAIILVTIKLALYNRMDELLILKLVGAKDSYVKTPFLMEGALLGFIAGIISIFALKIVDNAIIPSFQGTSIGEYLLSDYSTLSITEFFLILIIGTFLGLSGSYLATKNSIPN